MLAKHFGKAGLVLAALGLGGTASAYNLIGWDWSWQSSPMSTNFYFNPTSFPSQIGTQTLVNAALNNGINRWGTEGGANFSFKNGGATTQTSYSVDGLFVAQYSSATASGGTLAVAQSFGNGDRMTECDIRFYAANQFGSTPWRASTGSVSSSYVDLEQVVTHEFGHCAGLDHSGSSNSVMYPSYRGGSTTYRTLTADDKAGLVAMYGTGVVPNPTPDLSFEMETPLIGGQTATIRVRGALPNELLRFYASVNGLGSGPCPADLGGVCLGVANPAVLVMSRKANASGVATFKVTPPANFAGTTVGMQVVAPRGSNTVVSNVDRFEVRSASATCPSNWIQDCAATCVPPTYEADTYCDDGTTNYNDTTTGFQGYSDLSCSYFNYDGGDCN